MTSGIPTAVMIVPKRLLMLILLQHVYRLEKKLAHSRIPTVTMDYNLTWL